MFPQQKLLQQRMRPCDTRGFQWRIRGRQIIAPDKSKGYIGGTFEWLIRTNPRLVYRTVAGSRRRKRLRRLQIDGAKGLLILRQVLSQQVPQRLGLLRA